MEGWWLQEGCELISPERSLSWGLKELKNKQRTNLNHRLMDTNLQSSGETTDPMERKKKHANFLDRSMGPISNLNHSVLNPALDVPLGAIVLLHEPLSKNNMIFV